MNDNSMPDEGPKPFVTDIEADTLANENYRTTRWTGSNIQMTRMKIEPGHDIGLVVMTTHARTGFTRLVLGSVARNVLLHAEASVLVMRPKGDPRTN